MKYSIILPITLSLLPFSLAAPSPALGAGGNPNQQIIAPININISPPPPTNNAASIQTGMDIEIDTETTRPPTNINYSSLDEEPSNHSDGAKDLIRPSIGSGHHSEEDDDDKPRSFSAEGASTTYTTPAPGLWTVTKVLRTHERTSRCFRSHRYTHKTAMKTVKRMLDWYRFELDPYTGQDHLSSTICWWWEVKETGAVRYRRERIDAVTGVHEVQEDFGMKSADDKNSNRRVRFDRESGKGDVGLQVCMMGKQEKALEYWVLEEGVSNLLRDCAETRGSGEIVLGGFRVRLVGLGGLKGMSGVTRNAFDDFFTRGAGEWVDEYGGEGQKSGRDAEEM